tara:strand:+ start:11602 stop:12492 length:891 start_codon:yes stop_codon:yes gene_type:complete
MFKNSIKDRFKRSWDLTKKTFHVMSHDKEIILFPILSAVFSIVLFLLLIFPVVLSVMAGKFSTGAGSLYVGVFVFYFVAAFAATFFNAGVVHIARTRFEGGDATFMDGIRTGFKHFKHILGWSLITATVGLILNILTSQAEEKGGIAGVIGKIVISLIGLVWAIVSVFVVPAMVIKGIGPIKALKSSVKAIKKTWGESLIKYYGLGFAKGIIIGVAFLIFLIPAIIMMVGQSFIIAGVLLGIFVLIFTMTIVIFSSANTVFDTALFLYADTGKVPSFYDEEVIKHAFVSKPKKGIF